ncbi:Uncharacterized protein OBRU01_20548 [Operophtera brumata]|uniref:Uncharacterized protein n=1 Tax=Operophtera brumata TaxID=104452 RepID=A0A0L7KV33_OPEBR|nr:Uncharacterized protein OBRU01_20548 [Operophtera brumata]
MALRMKKDIKKASYYVWFLGAQESRGLRGEEFAIPAIAALEERSRNLEPFKVTLQTIKHFIPHGSITSAVVQGDVVACVLLLYNPVTGCPVHMLFTHLQALIDRPENQKKFADIERKLQMRGALPATKKPPDSSLGSEVSRESDSGSNEERCVANLYDSLAAELKQKLSTGKSPILLPPRDYDTVHRQKGNLSNIDTRRCLNQNIVGVNARRKLESSGGSSGIGKEDWAESTAYMMHEAFDASPRRAASPHRSPPPRRTLSPRFDREFSDDYTDTYRDQVAPFREQAPPFREQPAPFRDQSAPFRDQSAPFRDQSAPFRDQSAPFRDQPAPFRDPVAPFRDQTFERRFRNESPERKDKPDKFADETVNYRRRYIADTKPSNRSIDRVEDRRFGKLTRGTSEGSLKLADASPKDRFNVAKEKFKNLERERFNRELEQHMAIRRSMLERNSRSTSSPEEERRDERPERHRELSSRREPERSHRDLERSHREPERRKEPERTRDELGHREIERLPRVGRKREEGKRYEYSAEEYLNRMEPRIEPRMEPKPHRDEFVNRMEPKPHREEFDRYRERRELDCRIEEDEIIEPVIEERTTRRDWTDRQRAFSRSRLLEEQRQSYTGEDRDRYYDRDFRDYRDLAERQPNKFRHSYAEPIPRGRLGTVRPY